MRAAVTICVLASMACGRSSPPSEPPPSAPPHARGAAPSTHTGHDPPPPRDAVAALLGTTPVEWQVDSWLNSQPLSLASLRGSVVLVRWWTAGCPYCRASAPALREFHAEYASRGLRVIGLYHHKGREPFDPRIYADTARAYAFAFPLAVDTDWRTLDSWLRDVETGWTSITFVLDRRGVIRHIHPGGQYVKGDAAYAEMRAVLERLLAES